MSTGVSRIVSVATVLLATSSCGPPETTYAAQRDSLERLPVQGSAPTKLRIGISPGVGAASTDRAMPLRDYLQSALHLEVELVASHSYDELLGLLERESIDAAVLSPLTYVRARSRLPVVPLAAASSDGSPTFGGYLVVRDSSTFSTLGDLRGRSIAWTDSTSTSGYLYPRALMRHRGLDPDHYFGRIVFAGDHWSAIRMVSRGEVEVAAVASSFVDNGRTQRIPEADDVRVVAKTALIPYDCVVVLDAMPRPFARRLRDALYRLQSHTLVSARLASTWGFSAFVPVNEGRYDVVAEVNRMEHQQTEGTATPEAGPR